MRERVSSPGACPRQAVAEKEQTNLPKKITHWVNSPVKTEFNQAQSPSY